jgi:6-pyruvoyl-tetrahydropterin synthase-like protein
LIWATIVIAALGGAGVNIFLDARHWRRIISTPAKPVKHDGIADSPPSAIHLAENSLFPSPFLAIIAAAFAVVLPFAFRGNPSGHDFEFHVNSWMEVLSQWKHGIVYPRWAALAHYGYGEARFIFYPPASWMLGAALGAVLPWKAVPAAYIWVALALSGCSMFLLVHPWLNRTDAIFASALYAANPYYIVIVYWRSAFAELLAGALLPLLLLYILQLEERGRRAIIPLALIIAAAWLTNAPSAVMVNYSVALLVVVVAITGRSPRILLYGGLAVLLGAALAAFYICPAAYEEKWVNISEVLAPGVRPQDNFLFTTINDADHNRFNLLVSLVATTEIIVLALAVFFARRRQLLSPIGWIFMAWGTAATLLMFSLTASAWNHLPKLRFVQLPWRWLLCLNLVFSLLVPVAFRRWWTRLLVIVVLLAVVFLVWQRVQPPWWDTAADIEELLDNQQQGSGYEGVDEYVPANADASEVKQDASRVAVQGIATPQIHIQQWNPELKVFTADLQEARKLVLHLFNYPAWVVQINGRVASTETQELTGQMIIPVDAGQNRVEIRFVRTWDRALGGVISGTTFLLILAIGVFSRKGSANQ